MQQANALIHENSPYLQQHAYNPVHWLPWGAEALERSKQENKVILLSIGYSACHWCHVMEHECFEDEEVAALQNKYYINIKVDREERPDVDQVYMDAVQAMGMRGGWPLNVFLLPDGRPFYGGTYFPKSPWMQVLEGVQSALKNEHDQVMQSADQLTKALQRSELEKYQVGSARTELEEKELMLNSVRLLHNQLDTLDGGLGTAPKFPMPCIYEYMLLCSHYLAEPKADEIIRLTLEKMALGGIYDQAGGGFSRYAVDSAWQIPHFEKMLYDNAQLISLYSKAFRNYKDPLYEKVVRQSIGFLVRELMAPNGLYYSSLDADSEGVEGKFYVFSFEELNRIWGKDAALIAEYFRCEANGNWEHGNNILFPKVRAEVFAAQKGIIDFDQKLDHARQAIMQARENRVRPGLDHKLLLSWNALTISGLCEAYKAFADPAYLQMAQKAFATLLKEYKALDGALYRTLRPSAEPVKAFLEDYATFLLACLDLYELSGEPSLLFEAEKTIRFVEEQFYDPEDGFFHYSERSTELITNKKELFDNVIPSANALMANALLRYGRCTSRQSYIDKAIHMVQAVAHLIQAEPRYMSYWGTVHASAFLPAYELVFAGLQKEEEFALFQQYWPQLSLFPYREEQLAGPAAHKGPIQGKPTYYLCTQGACLQPVHTLSALMNLLAQNSAGNSSLE